MNFEKVPSQPFIWHSIEFDQCVEELDNCLHGLLANEFGEAEADRLMNPYAGAYGYQGILSHNTATDNHYADGYEVTFPMDIPQKIFDGLSHHAPKFKFELRESWFDGKRNVRFSFTGDPKRPVELKKP